MAIPKRSGVWLGALAVLVTARPAAAACVPETAATPPALSVSVLRSYQAYLHAPTRLAVDGADRLYVTDPRNGRVLAREADGRVALELSELGYPVSVAVTGDGARIYVGDGATGRVTAYDRNGAVRAILGAGNGEFRMPADIGIDAVTGEVFVADSRAHAVKRYGAGGALLQTIGGARGSANGQFDFPAGLYVNAATRELFVVDQRNARIQVLGLDGTFKFCLDSRVLVPVGFNCGGSSCSRVRQFDAGIWVDGAGRIFVADAFEGRVWVLARNGSLLNAVGGFGTLPGQLQTPADVAVDGGGRLYVAAANNSRIEIYGLDAYRDPERFLPGRLRVEPDPLDPALQPGLTAYLELPGFDLNLLAPETLRANGAFAPSSSAIGDADGNTIPDLALSFGAELLATLPPAPGEATIIVTGAAGSLQFAESDRIRLIDSADDDDLDGVSNADDRCPGTAAGDPAGPDGCGVAQRCPCAGPAAGVRWRNHGRYMNCIRDVTRELRDAGRITHQQRHDLRSAAAAAECGRRRAP